jgi:ABC-type sugar transport system permease subunit
MIVLTYVLAVTLPMPWGATILLLVQIAAVRLALHTSSARPDIAARGEHPVRGRRLLRVALATPWVTSFVGSLLEVEELADPLRLPR